MFRGLLFFVLVVLAIVGVLVVVYPNAPQKADTQPAGSPIEETLLREVKETRREVKLLSEKVDKIAETLNVAMPKPGAPKAIWGDLEVTKHDSYDDAYEATMNIIKAAEEIHHFGIGRSIPEIIQLLERGESVQTISWTYRLKK